MKKTILIVAALLTFSVFATQSFAQTTPAAPATAAPAGGGDVVASATSSDNYTAFSIALRAAGLTETLEGAGPYTIFAPTNEAFGKIPSAQLDALMKDQNARRKEMFKDESLSQADKDTKNKAIVAETREKIKAVLTPEQYTKWEKLHEARKAFKAAQKK